MGLPLTPCASFSFMRYRRQENKKYTKHIDFSVSLLSALKKKRKKDERKKKTRSQTDSRYALPGSSDFSHCHILLIPLYVSFPSRFFCQKNLSHGLRDSDVTPKKLSYSVIFCWRLLLISPHISELLIPFDHIFLVLPVNVVS